MINSSQDIIEGIEVLSRLDPRLAAVHALCGEPPLRRQENGLEALVWIIISQQVSVACAQSIWTRIKALFLPLTADSLLEATDETFRAAGLSAPKIKTLRALAAALHAGLDLQALGAMPADKAHDSLTAVSGIGPWTADIYLMICLGHADAFAAGDLALQEAARLVYALPSRPGAAQLLSLAEAWRPWRGVAARLLWAYYAMHKSGKGPAAETNAGAVAISPQNKE